MDHLNHLHLFGKAYISNPPRDVETANTWLTTLVDKIKMKILMGPYSIDCKTLGNEGVTGAVVIETSHATFHCWHAVERPFLMFDCYSCVGFDPATVVEHIDEHFDVSSVSWTFMDRNGDKAVILAQG